MMNQEREVLMNRIQVCDFALNDAALYLDTHPHDADALAYYSRYNEMAKAATKEFVMKFGPIVHSDYDGGDKWKWVDSPWPWQTDEEEA